MRDVYDKFLEADYKAISHQMTDRLVKVTKLCPFLLSLDHRLDILCMTQIGYISAQYNTVVSLAVPVRIRHLILTLLVTWLILNLHATPSHKIGIFLPFAQWFGNGSYSLRLSEMSHDLHRVDYPSVG